ncbi:putative bifunctional diguanylate cyclase/phosphodiesterase [Shewanella livingstonensis]|uniref:EAL domain-containing protein n=1 Tax=Shewanella livingstonensis TaxID=150120 RepID=A0A3G8LYK9_9GAMM|nr:EAL domain-containing protein [Shewanella livingstonensis]AZG74843.1 EAL domain-containing protein [Shewanella livingstonensis]
MDLRSLETETKSSIRMKRRARVDFFFGTLFIVMMVIISFVFQIDLVESVYLFTRSHEDWEMDEIIFSFLWIAIVATIYGIRRVLDIREVNKEVSQHAYYDSLTGLPNRSLAQYHLEKLLQRANRSPLTVCVIFIDLDNFKDINDSYGHDAGDLLIEKVGKRLASVVRHDETAARLGGDEFLIIGVFPQGSANIEALINRIESCQHAPFNINDRSISTGFSIGVALSPQHGDSVQALLVAADSAMYEAKRNKRDTACYYTNEIGQKITERYRLSSQLKQAIKNEQLYLVYQPIVCLLSGKIKGYETLTRWNLDGTLINPELIISLAEDIGVSEEFFKWLLKTTLASCNHFLKPDQFIAINVSARQFLDINFLINTQYIISKYSHVKIELEITESSLIADFTETINRIDSLNTLGIKVMIDDFGTGYSSLSRLKQLNVDKIKIDRSFLHDASKDQKSAGIYQSIVDLAHKLDIDVVAEGVETTEQLLFLRQFAPIYMQGYLFQKPQINTKQTAEFIIQDIILNS